MGSLNVAKLFSAMLILARFVLLQLTVMPSSDSISQLHGCSNNLSLGHLYRGPGGIYSARTVPHMPKAIRANNTVVILLWAWKVGHEMRIGGTGIVCAELLKL